MANELCSSLGLIDKNLSGKLLQVVEEHGADASFVLGSLMWNASRSNTSICLITFYNSFTHYEKVSKKLGYDLKIALDKKTAVILEPVATFSERVIKIDPAKEELEAGELGEVISSLLEDIKNSLASFSGKKCVVIDDLSAAINMGVGLAEVVSFLQCCRQLQESDPDLTLVIGSHVSKHCEDSRLLADFTSHVADLRVNVVPLRTGFSANVSGSLEVVDNLERVFGSTVEKKVFHFKLTDREIKVFSPGTAGIFG